MAKATTYFVWRRDAKTAFRCYSTANHELPGSGVVWSGEDFLVGRRVSTHLNASISRAETLPGQTLLPEVVASLVAEAMTAPKRSTPPKKARPLSSMRALPPCRAVTDGRVT